MLVRMGKFTASSAANLLLNKSTTSYEKTIYKVAFERMAKTTPETYANAHMQRGHDLEPLAIEAYERENLRSVEHVGFIEINDWVGCSPDGLVGDNGLVEIKCPAFDTMLKYMLNPDTLMAQYSAQVQYQMYVTERDWCDLAAYDPNLGLVIQRVFRDEDYIERLQAEIDTAIETVKSIIKQLKK